MAKPRRSRNKQSFPERSDFALEYYKLMLSAMGSREAQVLRMLAYLGAALAGLGWLVSADFHQRPYAFYLATFLLLSILAAGYCHTLAMAYNFRCAMAQAGKIERLAGYTPYILRKWSKRTAHSPVELCPEMFKAQLGLHAAVGVAVLSYGLLEGADITHEACWKVGSVLLAISLAVLSVAYSNYLKHKLASDVYHDPVLEEVPDEEA